MENTILIIAQCLGAFALFFAILYLISKWVEHVPQWLNYRPFNCETCASFWTNLFAFLVLGISTKMWWFMGLGLILTILNAVAQWYDQKYNAESLGV